MTADGAVAAIVKRARTMWVAAVEWTWRRIILAPDRALGGHWQGEAARRRVEKREAPGE